MIELLNEAAGFKGQQWQDVIRQFWLDGYGTVRSVAGGNVQIMIGEAFMGFEVCTFFFAFVFSSVFLGLDELSIISGSGRCLFRFCTTNPLLFISRYV